jgi:protease I
VKADRGIAEVSAADLDGVVIPGGYAPDFMRRDARFVNLVRDMNVAGKAVGSICHGGWLLCSARVVANRQATSFFSIKDDMIHAGALWVDESAVVDGNLVTSRIPDDLPDFCRSFLQVLASRL